MDANPSAYKGQLIRMKGEKAKGLGLSYKLINLIEDTARNMWYKQMYIETHDNLATAIHVYEKCGYKEIERPEAVVHGSMNRFYLKELR